MISLLLILLLLVLLFLYFSDFSIFYFILYEKQNKAKIEKWTNKNMLNKSMHKTRLTQNTKAKHTSNAKTKTRRGEREKVTKSFGAFSFHTLEEPFHLTNPWSGGEGEELKLFKFERNMRALRRSPRGEKEDGSWFWFPNEIILLLCWMANHL